MYTLKSTVCITFLGLIGLSFAEGKNDLEPLVAFHCGRRAMFQTPQGWTADNSTDCVTNPEDILTFCKKSFPDLDVRNYVETDREVVVEGWCDFAGENCHQSFLVQPFLCMVGPFVIVIPRVPDRCLMDQTIRLTECRTSTEWKSVASTSCAKHGMETNWFSVLQPCDIGKFSGVQYVCCPSGEVSIEVVNSFPAQVSEFSSTPEPTQARRDSTGEDVYVDVGKDQPESEHSRYVQVRAELQKKHNDEISKIMDAWDEAQQEVEKMRAKDPDMADKLEKKITARFQKTINSLEEKEEAEKRQVDSVHDQKVQIELNNKKREAMEDYMAILSNRKQATLKDVLKVLRHYVRVEQKDRMHAINHYLHVKDTDPASAESSRALVAEHLRTIRLRINRALEMLNRVPDYKEEIQKKIKDVLEEYQEFDNLESSIVEAVDTDADEDKSPQQEDEEDEYRGRTEERPETEGDSSLGTETDLQSDLETDEDLGKVAGSKSEAQQIQQLHAGTGHVLKTVDVDNEGIVQLEPAAHPNHVGASELRLEEQSALISRQSSTSSSGALAFIVTGSIFLLAIAILGMFLWRRKVAATRRRSKPSGDSLLLASQEQVHIASMQVNGYENPTYKYFEAKAVI